MMKRTTVALTLSALIMVLALVLVSSAPGLAPLESVAYAQDEAPPLGAPDLTARSVTTPDGSSVSVQLSWGAVPGADGYELYRHANGGDFGSAIAVTGTTYSDTDVATGVTYGYYLRAVAGGEGGPWSDYVAVEVSGERATAPTAAPANLIVTADGLTAVDISWGAVADAATYSIYRWDGSAGEFIHGLTGTSHEDTGLTTGTTYSYNIRAVNAAGNGPWSGYQSVTLAEPATATPEPTATPTATPEPTATPTPTPTLTAAERVPVLTLLQPSYQVVELSWTAVRGANVEYELQRSKGSGSYKSLSLDDPSATTFEDRGLAAGAYSYRVRSVADGVTSGWSIEKTATIPDDIRWPGVPENVSASGTGPNRIVVEWDAGDPDNASEYHVQWRRDDQDWSDVRQVTETDETYTHTRLTAGTKYFYRVRGENVNGTSDWSDEASATTLTDETVVADQLGPPTGVRVEDATTGTTTLKAKLKISWEQVDDDTETHYQILKWNTTAGRWGAFASDAEEDSFEIEPAPSNSARVSIEDTEVDIGGTYYYVVRAVVAAEDDVNEGIQANEISDYGEWSKSVSGTTKTYPPGRPTLTANGRSETTIWLSWEPASEDLTDKKVGKTTEYELWYRAGVSGSFKQINLETKGTESYLHESLARADTTYVYYVIARNAEGTKRSASAVVKPVGQQKPDTPLGVVVEDVSTFATDGTIMTSKLKVSWSEVDDATGYDVERWTGKKWDTVGSTTDKLELIDGVGLDKGAMYYYVVRAENNGVKGDWSTAMTGTTKSDPAGAPTLVATTVGEKMIRLSWSSVAGATSYELRYVKTKDAPATRLDHHWTVIKEDGMHYLLTGLDTGTQYEFNVRAVFPGNVFSAWSDDDDSNGTLDPAKTITRPARPDNFEVAAQPDATAVTSLRIVLEWDPVTFDRGLGTDSAATTPEHYEIQRMAKGVTPVAWVAVVTNNSGTTVCNIDRDGDDADEEISAPCLLDDSTISTSSNALANDTEYRYRIRARGTANDHMTYSYWQYSDYVTTPAAP